MFKIIEILHNYYTSWKDRKFLKKHNVNTWDEYNYYYDPDWNIKSDKLTDIFHGYSVILILPKQNWTDSGIFGLMIDVTNLQLWCSANCEGKFRILPMSTYKSADGNFYRNIFSQFASLTVKFNPLADEAEKAIVAFKNENDATNFILLYDGIEMQSNKKTEIIYVK